MFSFLLTHNQGQFYITQQIIFSDVISPHGTLEEIQSILILELIYIKWYYGFQ